MLATAQAIAAPAGAAIAPHAVVPQPSAYWLQIERRIEGAYFRQDAPALQALAATLPAGESRITGGQQQWRTYYSALLAYRLALLAGSDEARASPLTQHCIDGLNQALVLDPRSAEALALQSACLALQSRLDSWRSPLSAPLSLARIDKALQLAPDNPRVLLLGALAASDRPRLFGGDPRQAFTLLRRAVSAFEQQRGRARELPAWGAAEAFTSLALQYLTRGDTIAARNVLERALLVAPDFAQARSLMAKIVSG